MSPNSAIFTVQENYHNLKSYDLEDAIRETGNGKFHYLVIVVSGCCLLTVVTETIGISYVLPAAQCDLQLTTQDKGMVGAICFIGMIVSSHLWGFLADTLGRRKILIVTLLLDGIVAIICSFSHAIWFMLICRFFNGFFVCGPSAVVYAYLGEFFPTESRTRAIVWACGFVALAFLMLPGLAWIIIPLSWSWELPLYTYHSWRFFMLFCGLPSVLTACLLVFVMPETPKFLIEQQREQESLHVLQRIFSINTGKRPDEYPVKLLSHTGLNNGSLTVDPPGKSLNKIVAVVWDQTRPLFLPPYLSNTIMGCVLEFGLYASANGYILWLPEIFNRLAEHSAMYPESDDSLCTIMSSALTSNSTFNETQECTSDVNSSVYINTLVNAAFMGIAFIAGGWLVSIIGKQILLFSSLLISGLAATATYFVNQSVHVLALSAVTSCLTGMCVSIVTSIVVDVFPTHLRAMAVCIALMMGRLGTAVSSVFIGALIEVSCASVFFVMGGTIIACGMLSLVFAQPLKQKSTCL